MLTPILEKMILCGQASYNTFVAGGTQKNILNVKKDHYIIIIGINYQSMIPTSYNNSGIPIFNYEQFDQFLKLSFNSQLKVFSTKSNNSFLFRNNFDFQIIGNTSNLETCQYFMTPKNSIKLDTYLIHESDVSFTLSNAGTTERNLIGLTPADSIGFPPPFDYGKAGQTGAQNVVLHSFDGLTPDNGFKSAGTQLDQLGTFSKSNLEFVFPVDAAHNLRDVNQAISYPIINIEYIEIKGRITNIEATL